MLSRLEQFRSRAWSRKELGSQQTVWVFLGTLAAATLLLAEPGLIVNGLLLGSTLALGAIGLSLIFGILRFVHIAHGDFMTLGAYVAFFAVVVVFPKVGWTQVGLGPFTFGYPLLIALPLALLAVAGVAIGIDRLVYRTLRLRGSPAIVMTMASLGIAIALRAIVQMLWGTQPEHYPRLSRDFFQLPLDIRIPPDNLFLGVVSVSLVAGLFLFLTRTKTGKAMRATADNPELARISGINTEQIIRWTWILGACLAATAGTLLAVSQAQLLPILGWKVLIPIFAATILGGVGSTYGAFVGALIVGVSMEASTQWITPSYKPAVAFVIILLVLLLRPNGIFTKEGN
ncbi:MAG: branched-chain amino acid ABC transporter permease [Dehalococcoidia bacterium]